jgi:hypothetical protein
MRLLDPIFCGHKRKAGWAGNGPSARVSIRMRAPRGTGHGELVKDETLRLVDGVTERLVVSFDAGSVEATDSSEVGRAR